MVKRRKSLLDAFRATGPSTGAVPPGSAPPAAKMPGMFAPVGAPRPAAAAVPPAAQPLASSSPAEPRVAAEPVLVEHVPAVRAPMPASSNSSGAGTSSSAGSASPARSHAPASAPAVAHEPALSSPSSRDRVVILLVCSALLLIAVAWWVRAHPSGSKETLAAGDSAQPTEAEAGSVHDETPAALDGRPSSKAPAASNATVEDRARIQAPAYGYTTHDQAFLDKRFRFTLRLVQYNNDDTGVGLAKATYQYLVDEGLPVVQPIETGNKKHILLCAGYAAKQDDLAGMRKHVAALRGQKPEPKKPPFEGAYVVNIDDVITRP